MLKARYGVRFLSIGLCLLFLYVLWRELKSDYSNVTCPVKSGEHHCQILKDSCNNKYFAVAIKYYCSNYYPSKFLEVFIACNLILILILLLSTLSTIVSNYMYVSLESFAEIFKINGHTLSFILIPLINALPDLIDYHITIKAKSIELVLGQLIGSSLILCTVIIGVICIIRPFNILDFKHLMTDLVWLLATLIMLIFILSDEKITVMECAVMMTGYLFYIFYLFWFGKESEREMADVVLNFEEVLDNISDEDLVGYGSTGSIKSDSSENIVEEIIILDSINVLKIYFAILDNLLFYLIPISSSQHEDKDVLNQDIFVKLWFSFEIPILINIQFFNISWINMIPIILLLTLLNQFLNISRRLGTVSINVLSMVICLILISAISVQILKILKNFGLIFKISDYILGLLVFSISNSINDLITNVTIAIKVSPVYGVNSCLGTPILLTLVGIGMHGFYVSLIDNYLITFSLNKNLILSTIALISVTLFFLIYVPLNKWNFDSRLGIILVSAYFIISLMNCLTDSD
ncbi:uncharacterized protein PRCAT00001657001 [Priceomyces carsonii]|uniref:uncharacterized protein n=1 Tax=Priceomyces carsonii TaxID=28549 RepID=UPI002ED88EDB|nr:unnamed protein product [Priceomyces carsonii]